MKGYLPMIIIGAVLGMSAWGCGKSHYPLKGKITYADGTPVTAGMVNFDSGTSLSRGKIQSDGSYAVGTLKDRDGIPKGSYKIYITGAETAMETDPAKNPPMNPSMVDSMGNPMQTMAAYRKLVHPKYMTASQSPLSCEVPAEKNRFDIIVEPPIY